MRHTGSGDMSSRSSVSSTRRKAGSARPAPGRYLVVCLDNAGYEASLERRKFYVALRDSAATRAGHVRVVDESGESYLYPVTMFAAPPLPPLLRRRLLQAS